MRGNLKLFTEVRIIKGMLAKKLVEGSGFYSLAGVSSNLYLLIVMVNLHDEHAILRH